jgi:putative sterol carrier protein
MLADITKRIAEALGDQDSGLGKTLKIDFGQDGQIFVDAARTPHIVSNEDKPADCTVKITLQHFLDLASGKLNPAMALFQKKLQVEGDMAVAMKLGALLQKGR